MMVWSHTHRDGTHHRHPKGTECDLHLPEKLRDPVTGLTETETAAVVAELEDKNAPDPAYHQGRVDFSEMLTQDWQWSIKHRLDALLGRPYTSTQVAALLPADVALRLTDRIEHVIQERVRAEIDRIQDDITNATAQTLARLASQADEKMKELRNERFNTGSRLA